MTALLRYFTSHPTAANIFMAAIVIIGLVSLPSLNRETFPQLKTSEVAVTVAYPGASPSEVEEGICNRLEDATDGISFLKEQTCVARDNVGVMTLEIQEAGDIRDFLGDIETAVDAISDFPGNTEDPVIKELGRTQHVVSIAITSDLNMPELKALAEDYRNRLLAMPEIPMVTVTGFSTHEYSVLVRPETLRQYKLSIDNVANLISAQSVSMPAGVLDGSDRSYQIRFENERRSVTQLADLVIMNSEGGGQVRLGDIARIEDSFSDEEQRVEVNGHPAAILQISKNTTDDTLKVYNTVQAFVGQENARLPQGTELLITQDMASIVQDRLSLLLKNAAQGLVLAGLVLFLFYSWRFTFWVVVGLPVSFLGGLAVMSALGMTINMISMVALLMAIGILMDDAIVLSESIENEHRQGKSPLDAAIAGVSKVARGVMASFTTSAILFGSLLTLKGDMGQILGVLPVVLLSVLTISLVEAFLILPRHLAHSMELHAETATAQWRLRFEAAFARLREKVGNAAHLAVRFRYLTVGIAIAAFVLSVSLMASGIVKFKGFPDVEGNLLEARVLMPQGTSLQRTEAMVETLLESLDKSVAEMKPEPSGDLVETVQVRYGQNSDAGEEGAHLATITVDLLDAELRVNSLLTLKQHWRENTPLQANASIINFREPALGPAGQAIGIRLQGSDLEQLSHASWEIQNWLKGYPGVSNIMDNLRPGKPQFNVTLYPGSLDVGLNAQSVAAQLRSAYQGIEVHEVYQGREAYEVNVSLDVPADEALDIFEQMPVFSSKGVEIPLGAVARIEETQEYSQITRINHLRTITITGDIESAEANTNEVLGDTQLRLLSGIEKRYPGIKIGFEGEVENTQETSGSVVAGFVLGIFGVYFLLSLLFKNYREPVVVLLNIPLALIGVVLGHLVMGLNITLPSMIGFVAMAGVVVNDSILLVEFVKLRSREGMSLHDAAEQAVKDRFRAIFLTSLTTIAGMLPLLSETSLQAQILIPIVASVVFGMMASTLLLIFVLPAAYSILEDFGFTELDETEAAPE